MTLLHFPFPSPSSSPSLLQPISSSFRPKPISLKLPARDRIIDFGKHKGKMMGTLPSKYLTWVSKNLRARDFEEWAKLADKVLQDPVYRDRIEWESAERILSGEGLKSSRSESPVSNLHEISDRFGWDNEDKAGWNRVDFDMLGTSRGGRIPRVRSPLSVEGEEMGRERKLGLLGSSEEDRRLRKEKKGGFFSRDSRVLKREVGHLEKKLGFPSGGFGVSQSMISGVSEDKRVEVEKGRKVGFLGEGYRFCVEEEEGVDEEEEEIGRGKREERREKQREKRVQQMKMLRREVGVEEDGRSDGIFIKEQGGCNGPLLLNPFPGRRALLDKMNRQGN